MFTVNHLAMGQVENEQFETEEAAIEWAFDTLPTDDIAYVVADEATGDYTCIVFQGQEWRPYP